MRATTLKAGGTGVTALVGYYAGLAEDQLRRDGRSRGPIDYYLDPNEPPGRWWGEGCPAGVEGVRFHDLRHTAVAMAIAEGAHPKTIQARMGHASVQITPRPLRAPVPRA